MQAASTPILNCDMDPPARRAHGTTWVGRVQGSLQTRLATCRFSPNAPHVASCLAFLCVPTRRPCLPLCVRRPARSTRQRGLVRDLVPRLRLEPGAEPCAYLREPSLGRRRQQAHRQQRPQDQQPRPAIRAFLLVCLLSSLGLREHGPGQQDHHHGVRGRRLRYVSPRPEDCRHTAGMRRRLTPRQERARSRCGW
jgi:hypothetical protein